MAICASCGAASAEGAIACASCGRPLAPPPPPAAPPVGPPSSYGPPPAGPPSYGPPPVAPPGHAPPAVPPAVGGWGTGTPYDAAAAQPAVLRWLTGSDWRPALKAVIAPTAVLLLVALIAAIPSDYDLGELVGTPEFGDRFGMTLAMALGGLGAPFKLGFSGGMIRSAGSSDVVLRVVPMTVTVLWLFTLWLGLRAGARLRQARTGAQPTRSQAAGEALRTAVLAAGVTLLVGLVGGATWRPVVDRRSVFGSDSYGGFEYVADSGWLEAVGWTLLLAGLLAFAVHGTDALRWAAWRNRAVRGWAVAGLTAGRALALSVGLSSLAAFVVVAAQDEGWQTGVSLAFLPNLGLLLLGVGSGATARAGRGTTGYEGGYDGDGYRDSDSPAEELSFFDLHGESADWRWAGLLALAAVAFLGWTAYRRRLDALDRIRLAVVYAAGLTLLMAVAGFLATTTSSGSGTWSGRGDSGREFSVSLAFATVLAANVIWAAVGALAVPPALAALRRGGPGATAPGTVPAQGAPYGPGPEAYGPGQVVADPPVAVVGEVIGSHEAPPASGPAVVSAERPPGEDTPDPSVWRKQP
ncbi:hypothetical protein ACFVVX_22785 [Kitasatospora sp. NPDC058170]|uniref:hypothetical protein n=1 Tax=Kitasatospora sp. NPDC058170 TaxID=3346364 RepID=UPI0036DB1E21